MKFAVPQNLKTEFHPFRQIAVSSFIKGGLSILLGLILLLTVKSDFIEGNRVIGSEKIIAALGFSPISVCYHLV